MLEFVVIVESNADARTATKLAERVLLEKIEWLEPEILHNLLQWRGLEADTEHSYWKDTNTIIAKAKEAGLPIPRYLGRSKTGASKTDGAAAMKILNLVRLLVIKSIVRFELFCSFET